jgi:hypothetical protein
MVVQWDDTVDSVLGGDSAAGFSYVTPAGGVVVLPMATIGLRDRAAGTVTLTTSVGLPKKLHRLQQNPRVAISYHAREHGECTVPLHVVVQGTAALSPPDREWLRSITPQWEKFLGPRHHGLLGRLMDVYYWERVAITIQICRIWMFDGVNPEPQVLGEAPPADPAPQAPPRAGTTPRVDAMKTASHMNRLPHSVLGWVGGDGMPMLTRVAAAGVSPAGIRLTGLDAALPAGGRRAGLTSHMFRKHMIGQEQRVHTGWLTVDNDGALYAPHTEKGYALPGSPLLMAVGGGIATRRGARQAAKEGLRF